MKVFLLLIFGILKSPLVFANERLTEARSSTNESSIVEADYFRWPGIGRVSWAEGQRGEFDYVGLELLKWKDFALPHNFGPGRDPIWYRFSVTNDDIKKQSFLLHAIKSHIADFAILHIKDSTGKIDTFYSGYKVPTHLKPIVVRDEEFHFELAPHETVELTLGVSSIYNRNMLYQLTALQNQRSSGEDMLFGVHFGVCLFALGLNFAIWLILRQNFYLSFAVVTGFSVLAQLIGIGYLKIFLPEVISKILPEIQLILLPIMIGPRMWFARDFLKVKTFSRALWLISSFLIYACIPLAFLASVPSFNQYTMTLTSIYGAVVGAVALISAIGAIRNKSVKFGYLYFIGFLMTFVGGGFWYLGFSGQIIPTSFVMNHYINGIFLENCIIAFLFFRQLRELNVQASLANANIREAERMNMFIKVLNHDLRNYGTIIKRSGESMLLKAGTSNELLKLSNRIINAVNRQIDVLTSVQKLANLYRQRLKLKLEPVNLELVLSQLEDVSQSLLDGKNIRLSMKSMCDGSTFVWADRKMLLDHVLTNVLHNAIKYSHWGGSIEILIRCSSDAGIVVVRDHGDGMSRPQIKNLFSPERMSSRPGTNGERGSGLGLTICKAYMELFNGSIEVDSVSMEDGLNDHGTSVTLKLCLAPQNDQLLQPERASFLPQTQSGLHLE